MIEITDINKAEQRGAPNKVPYPDVVIEDDYILKYKKNVDEPELVGRATRISEVKRNIHTDEVLITVHFNYQGQEITLDIKREKLTKQGILSLTKYGADISDLNSGDVLRSLINQENSAPLKLVHDRIGWYNYNGKKIFCLEKAIGLDSEYVGNENIGNKGTFEEWKTCMENEVLKSVPLQFALVLGLCAPVLSLISQRTGMELLMVNIFGDSSKGKTTAIRVATSTFGFPHTKDNGLIKTWNGTKNAILAHFRNNFGVPTALDEASMHQDDNHGKFIYQIVNGEDKARCTKDGTKNDQAAWSTVILSTGESSLLNDQNQNTGIKVRLLEAGNIEWTLGADHADIIRETLMSNYGHAGIIFVEYLMELGEEIVFQSWEDFRSQCFDKLSNKDSFSKRISDKHAIIMATAQMTKEALGIELDLEGISELLVNMDSEAIQQRDIGESAYEYFMEQFQINRKNFLDEDSSSFKPNHQVWGRCVTKNRKLKEIYVLPTVLTNILKSGGFTSKGVIIESWKKKGYLDCDKDKPYRKRKLHSTGSDTKVHSIQVKDDFKESRSTSLIKQAEEPVISNQSPSPRRKSILPRSFYDENGELKRGNSLKSPPTIVS